VYWYLEVMRKYAVFSGRARRKEYWMFQLVNFIVVVLLAVTSIPSLVGHSRGVFPGFLFLGMCGYLLATIIPSMAVSVRRLHDINFSGLWLLLGFVPAGGLALLILHVLDGTPAPNQYGPDPKDRGMPAAASDYNPRVRAMSMGAGTTSGGRSLGFCDTCGTALLPGAPYCPRCGKSAR